MKVFVVVFVAICCVAMVTAQSPLAALAGMGGLSGQGGSSLMTMAALHSKYLLFFQII